MMSFIKRRWYILLIIILVIWFIVYQKQNATTATNKNSTYTVKRQTLEEDLSLSGKIDAVQKATVTFQSSGKIISVGAKEGDYVTKGQLIAALDQRDIQMKLQKYLNTYTKTRIDFDQSQSDTREVVIGGLTKDQREKALRAFDKAQQDLNNAVLDVELQKLAGEYAYISSPIDGILIQSDAQYPGINVTAGVQKYIVVNPDSVYFSATADQTDLPNIQHVYSGDITLDAYPDEKLKGEIGSIGFTPKEGESGTVYEVKVLLSKNNTVDSYTYQTHKMRNPALLRHTKGDYRYRLGMTGDISFVLKKKQNSIAVPSRFVKSEGDTEYTYVLKDGKKVKTYVKTGDIYDINTEILSGLQEGDVVTE